MNGSYPLAWPQGWPRTDGMRRKQAVFKVRSFEHARLRLDRELRLLDAMGVTLSTNVALRVTDCLPKSGQAQPADPGVAVYFSLPKSETEGRVLACDRWQKVEHNMVAVALHIESLRGMERWGVGSMERAFTGYAALPPARAPEAWRTVLGFAPGLSVTAAEIAARFREHVKLRHEGTNGNGPDITNLMEARDQALKSLEAGR